MEKIETERLILRPFAEKDLRDLFEYASIDGVGEAAGWKHHGSLEESARILKMFMEDPLENAIVLKSGNKVIGSLGLRAGSRIAQDFPDKRIYEAGYVLSPFYEKHGYMTEALNAVIDFFFQKDRADLFAVSHFEGNEKSKGVILRCGFTFYKVLKNVYFKPLDESKDLRVYLLKKEDRLANPER